MLIEPSFPGKVAEKEVIEIRLDNVIVNKYAEFNLQMQQNSD